MDYAKAARGALTQGDILRIIDDQSELELNHQLDASEKSLLFSRFSPELIVSRIRQFGYGSFKFMWFLCRRPQLKCDISFEAIPRDGNCLLHALCDGIYNNDAFKNTTGDANNEKWTQLLLDLKFFDDLDDKEHIMELRRRFVCGAADWMAGNNNSLQNDKAVCGYTDNEWQYIWSTMIEDGAWAVPGIKDEDGHVIKENYAPEIFIKFIAHDLKANIIVFDLVLDDIQFVSGNLLKSSNVVFDSPLLMYTTGNHFQSVLQTDHQFFVNLAIELEGKNI